MKVSVVVTVLNEVSSIKVFIDSLLTQSKRPDEIVIVDGGSNDGTVEVIQQLSREHPEVRLIVDSKCNIKFTPSPVAKGRNLAIRNTTNDVIAVTDAGCRLDPAWLENITAPFESNKEIEVVGGWYEPWIDTTFERATASVTFTITKEGILKDYFPSSRSIAFLKQTWKEVGGYPEVALTAEDELFDKYLQQIGARYVFTDKAVVYWKPRSDFYSLVRQFYRYSKGGAICGLDAGMHARLFSKYLAFAVLVLIWVWTGNSFWFWLALFLTSAYFIKILMSARYRGTRFLSSLLKIAIDIARIDGYVVGVGKRMHGKGW